MGKAPQVFSIALRKGGWLFAARVILSLVVVGFAANVVVTTSSYQAEVGSLVNVPGVLVVTSISYFKASASSAATSCSVPVLFGLSGQVASTSITSGDWVYDVRVNSTASTPILTFYNVSFALGSTSFGDVCTESAGSVNSNLFIDCKYDVGTTLPASPYSFKITSP